MYTGGGGGKGAGTGTAATGAAAAGRGGIGPAFSRAKFLAALAPMSAGGVGVSGIGAVSGGGTTLLPAAMRGEVSEGVWDIFSYGGTKGTMTAIWLTMTPTHFTENS